MLDIKDIVKLDDNKKYIIMSKTFLDDNTYYYLLDQKDYTNYKFCLEKDDSLIEVDDPVLLNNLVKLFAKGLRQELKEL